MFYVVVISRVGVKINVSYYMIKLDFLTLTLCREKVVPVRLSETEFEMKDSRCLPTVGGLGRRLAAWHLPDGPVCPPARWATTT